MFTLIEKSLTPDLIASLPAGAHKLLNAARLEPQATNRRYQALTGYQERSIRSFIAILVDTGLAERVQYQPVKMNAQEFADLSAEQQINFERLRIIGVTDAAANRFVRTHSAELLEASLRYIKKVQAVKPAAYLVWCLENPHIWFESHNQKAEPNRIERTEPLFTPESLTENRSPRGLATQPLYDRMGQAINVNNDNREVVLLAYALEAATGVDIRLSEKAQQTVQTLYQAGYVAEEIAIFTDEIFSRDWRGKKGEQPTLEILQHGIAATKHRVGALRAASSNDSLLKREQAIRKYFPDDQAINCLADLWNDEIRRGLDRANQEETNCPECGQFWSMCCCGQPEPLRVYQGFDARMWAALIAQLSVQLNRATFECWVKRLRLVEFERGDECDIFTAAVSALYIKDYLETHLRAAMVQILSKMHAKSVQIEFVVMG